MSPTAFSINLWNVAGARDALQHTLEPEKYHGTYKGSLSFVLSAILI